MSINWNYYLSRYQQARGGHYFGALEDDYDCHLILTEGEDSPILVWIDTDPADGCFEHNLLARTMVRLEGEYNLHIRARSLVGSVANLMGGGELSHVEALRGRRVTTNDKARTRAILEEEDLCSGLIACREAHLRIRPAPRKEEGWHVVEVADIDFEDSAIGTSLWISAAMEEPNAQMSAAEREALLQRSSDHFNAQMDAFLEVIRAARRAVTTRGTEKGR